MFVIWKMKPFILHIERDMFTKMFSFLHSGSSITYDEGVNHSGTGEYWLNAVFKNIIYVCLFTLDDTLNCERGRRTLVKCTDTIVESNIDPIVLARKLYSEEIISEDVYKIVKDKKTGDTSAERLDYILDNLKDQVKHNFSAFTIFLDILRDDGLNQRDLANKIMSKYKDMIH